MTLISQSQSILNESRGEPRDVDCKLNPEIRFRRDSDDTTVISDNNSEYKDLKDRHTILQSKYYNMVEKCNSLQNTIKDRFRDSSNFAEESDKVD